MKRRAPAKPTARVEELLEAARRSLPSRLSPADAARELEAGALLIDIRGDDQRRADGMIPDATVMPRNSLEWRCDPHSAWRHPRIRDHQQRVVLICNEGFQSSLAAANLQQLGLRNATDVIGGFTAWRAAGLAVVPWDTVKDLGSRENANMQPNAHWDAVYDRSGTSGVSWYQAHPSVSMELIEALGIHARSSVIDVGAGRSSLAAALLQRGFSDITLLDLSDAALASMHDQLADRNVQFVHEDVLTWLPQRRYDLWHDRAVLHFFVDVADRARYVATLKAAVAPGGAVVVGVFAADGPEHCSGLPVMRYSSAQLAELLGGEFEMIAQRREEHVTPAAVVQPFQWAAFTRRQSAA